MKYLTLVLGAALTLSAHSSAAQSAKPPLLRLQHESDKFVYNIKVRPGVPEPGTTVNLEIELSELLATPHPRYGRRKPINDASVHVVLVGPVAPAKGKKASASGFLASHQAVKLADAGTYGVTFLGSEAGVYGAYIRGSAPGVGALEHQFALPYGVWPIDEGAPLPALPKIMPEPAAGDAASGKSLCATHCRTDVAEASPKGQAPRLLASSFGASRNDAAFLAALTKGSAKSLSPSQKANLLYYLRSLHMTVQDFFPEAAAYMPAPMEINEYGRDRLKDSGHPIAEELAKGTVFVVYKAAEGQAKPAQPTLVPYEDTIARDRLDKSNRIGYLVFTSLKGEASAHELAIAMEREPSYKIKALQARGADGAQNAKFQQSLTAFVGQGAFNDPKSLKGGNPKLRQQLLPLYLWAAELATAYFGEERQFTEFDGAF